MDTSTTLTTIKIIIVTINNLTIESIKWIIKIGD